MADDKPIYNPSIDNSNFDEPPRINPSTGISNFTRKENGKAGRRMAEKMIAQSEKAQEREATLKRLQNEKNIGSYVRLGLSKEGKTIAIPERKKYLTSKAYGRVVGIVKAKQKSKPKTIFGSYLGLKRRGRPVKDQLKVLRLRNMLDKKRLQNQIQRLKLSRQIELLRKKGMLKQAITQPVIKRNMLQYPAYATQEIINDIDSMYADIGHADESLWGNEQYYNEDYYGTEFDNDPFFHLNIKPRDGVSPLWW